MKGAEREKGEATKGCWVEEEIRTAARRRCQRQLIQEETD